MINVLTEFAHYCVKSLKSKKKSFIIKGNLISVSFNIFTSKLAATDMDTFCPMQQLSPLQEAPAAHFAGMTMLMSF